MGDCYFVKFWMIWVVSGFEKVNSSVMARLMMNVVLIRLVSRNMWFCSSGISFG